MVWRRLSGPVRVGGGEKDEQELGVGQLLLVRTLARGSCQQQPFSVLDIPRRRRLQTTIAAAWAQTWVT